MSFVYDIHWDHIIDVLLVASVLVPTILLIADGLSLFKKADKIDPKNKVDR